MKLPFDKCYCLHLTEATDRYNNIKEQFKKLGIEDQVEIWWTTYRPWGTQCGEMIPNLHSKAYDYIRDNYNKDLYGAVYNVSLEFYTMIKQAYLRGFNSILFMEDDIYFKDDFDYEHLFNNLPEDWDILRLGFAANHDNWIQKEPIYNECDDMLLRANWQFGGMCLCAFNRKAMKFYIDYMDEKFEYADAPLSFCFNNNNKKYLCDGEPLKVWVARQSIVAVGGFGSTIHSKIN